MAENVNDVAPVLISKCNHKQIRGRNAITTGWSIDNDGLYKQFLEKALLHVTSRRICRLNYDTMYKLPYMVVNHLCTIQRPPITLGCVRTLLFVKKKKNCKNGIEIGNFFRVIVVVHY